MTNFCLHISDIAITTVKNADDHCVIYNIRKYNPINLLENYVFRDGGYIQKDIVFDFSLLKAGFFYNFVKCEYSMDIYKSVKISVRTII